MCASTTGASNLVVTAWLRDVAGVLAVERWLADRLPWMTVADSSINLRTSKRVGWLLSPEGRFTDLVVKPSALANLRT